MIREGAALIRHSADRYENQVTFRDDLLDPIETACKTCTDAHGETLMNLLSCANISRMYRL